MTDLPPVFKDLPRADQIALFESILDGVRVELFSPLTEMWVEKESSGFNDNFHYRIASTKPSIDWSHVSDEYKWLSTGENGNSYLTTFKPRTLESIWIGGRSYIKATGFASFKPGACDWRDSLVGRPV